jgi:ubiquinone/menaquinone biosynthesis C-methylase UbiE
MAEKSVDTVGYYRSQAQSSGLAPTATMPDAHVVEAEIDAILRFLHKMADQSQFTRVLEIGCGNGYLASVIHRTFGNRFHYEGIDLTPDMVKLAKSRDLPYRFSEGSILSLDLAAESVDLVISDRVVINVLDPEGQYKAFKELARVTRKGGRLMFIEGFKQGLENLNLARSQFVMDPIPEPEVNNWFTQERWLRCLSAGFREFDETESGGLAPWNFLSSHYFMTRFVHDAIRPPGGAVRNTEFAKFFARALPPVGDYSPLRIAYLERS